jgi:hypothetical protein
LGSFIITDGDQVRHVVERPRLFKGETGLKIEKPISKKTEDMIDKEDT